MSKATNDKEMGEGNNKIKILGVLIAVAMIVLLSSGVAGYDDGKNESGDGLPDLFFQFVYIHKPNISILFHNLYNPEYKHFLKTCEIDEKLKEVFESENVSLSDTTSISRIDNRTCVISNKINSYIAEKREDRVVLYQLMNITDGQIINIYAQTSNLKRDINSVNVCLFVDGILIEKHNETLKSGLYLFSWNDIPGNDTKRLLKYLREHLKIEWVESASIIKIDNDEGIFVSNGENSLMFTINEEEEFGTLKSSDGRILNDYILKKENSKLNIYENVINLVKFDWNTTKGNPMGWNATVGYHTLTIKVDCDDVVDETNETNNEMSGLIYINRVEEDNFTSKYKNWIYSVLILILLLLISSLLYLNKIKK